MGRLNQLYTSLLSLQDTDTATKREIVLKCLVLNMGEAVEDLIKDFLVRQGYFRNVKMLAKAVHFKVSCQTVQMYV